MSNKMLIDATHAEETRVAVVRGNRIEEFDFESQEKKQLKGNIYLAKVTRVEPSLQAAFVDYGGNRHGFLAFSEIHPDYYQIPVADRQALLEAEAAEARAAQEAENEAEVASDSDNGDGEEEKPKKKSRRRRGRRSKSADAVEAQSEEANTEETASSEDDNDAASAENEPSPSGDDGVEAADAGASSETEVKASETEDVSEEKPKRRRTTRSRKPKKKEEDAVEASTEEAPASDEASGDGDGESDDDGNTVISAIIETDSISEPLPEDGEEEDTSEAEEVEETTEVEEKPKRRRVSRPRKKKADAEESVATDEAVSEAEVASEAEAETEAKSEEADVNASEAEEEKPKKRTRRRTSRKKKEAAEEAASNEEATSLEASDDADNEADGETSEEAQSSDAVDGNGDDSVESVGQEDELEEISKPRRSRRMYKIQEVIKRRQVLLIQVVKEERGNKGAALTTYLSLAGRYSVLMPNTAKGGGISRKITNSADRKRLKALAADLDVPAGMGVILRTAGAARTDAEITRDFEYLMRLWEQVRTLTLSSTAPCLVYEEGSLIKRSIRDLYDKDTSEVLVAGEHGFEEAKEFMGMLMPEHTKKVKRYKGNQALLTKFGVESQLENMLSPQVTLKSGGYLVINQTEALVAVDVNSGRATREHSVENTALQTNLEAAEEVARQLRLRDLAGLIVIDFIDMEERRNNRAVEKRLKECLKNDRARIQVGRISHFGLMEMSRQRMRASVLESTMDVCESCAGTGYVRSDSAIALHVFRSIEEHVSRHNKYDCIVKTSAGTAIHLLNHKRAGLTELEERFGLKILVEPSETAKGQEFSLHKGELATGEAKPAAVGMDNGGDVDAQDEASEDDAGEKKGRGRRSRRRGKKDAAAETEATETSNGLEEPAENEASEGEDDGGKRRKRGNRGGRKKASKDDAVVVDAEADAKADPQPAEAEAVETETPSEEEAEPPKRRSTRRKKAPVAKKVAPAETATEEIAQASEPSADTASAPEADADVKAETEKPKRRRTTRPKKSSEPADTETSQDAGDTKEEDDGDGDAAGKGKQPWWSGGGFF